MDNEDKKPDEEEIPLIELNIDIDSIDTNNPEDKILPLAGAAMPLKDEREAKQPIMPLAGADILPDIEKWPPIPREPLCGDILPGGFNDNGQKKTKRKSLKKKSKKSKD